MLTEGVTLSGFPYRMMTVYGCNSGEAHLRVPKVQRVILTPISQAKGQR